MTHRSPSCPLSWNAPSSITTTRPGPSTAKGTRLIRARPRLETKHSRAPSTEAIANDQTMRYMRSRWSVTMLGPGWMP
jgi:hypothetical protein